MENSGVPAFPPFNNTCVLNPIDLPRSTELYGASVACGSPITVKCRPVPPVWVSETRQGYVAVVVFAVFTAVMVVGHPAYYRR